MKLHERRGIFKQERKQLFAFGSSSLNAFGKHHEPIILILPRFPCTTIIHIVKKKYISNFTIFKLR
jgi:hypothetical protein